MNHWHLASLLRRAGLALWAAVFALALLFPSGAKAAPWGKRVFWLEEECFHLSLPSDWGPLRSGGGGSAGATFVDNGLTGLLLLSATPLEKVKGSLEAAGLSVADWLIDGIAKGDPSALFSVTQLAKAAGLQAAAVEDAGRQKALIYEVMKENTPAALAVCIQGETVVTAQISLEGAESPSRQRELVRQVVAGLGVEHTNIHFFGKQAIHVPGDWAFWGTDGNASIGFEFEQNGTTVSAVACVLRLGISGSSGLPAGSGELTASMRGMLEKMLIKWEEAGLIADDGLVRLYDISSAGSPFWMAVFVSGDAGIVCGIAVQGDGHSGAREAIEVFVRGMEAMKTTNRALATVAGP